MLFAFCIALCLCVHASVALQYASFDAASASSTYSTDSLNGSPAFAAAQALSVGSGYWCSSGKVADDGKIMHNFKTGSRQWGATRANFEHKQPATRQRRSLMRLAASRVSGCCLDLVCLLLGASDIALVVRDLRWRLCVLTNCYVHVF